MDNKWEQGGKIPPREAGLELLNGSQAKCYSLSREILNWFIAKEASYSTTLKKKKKEKKEPQENPTKKTKQQTQQKVPTKKNCVSILLFIYKNHIKTMVLEEHCKHTTRCFLETDFSSVIAP